MKGKNNAKKTRGAKATRTPADTGSSATAAKPTKVEQTADEIRKLVKKERETGTAVFQITKNPDSLSADAYRWIMSPGSIPEAMFAPIRFVGWTVIREFFALLGRPLELSEAQMLVQADGEMETCAIDDIRFQPVRYAPFVSQDTEAAIKAGKPLDTGTFYYGGAFYQDDRIHDGRIIPVSGCVFNSRDRRAEGSPLVITALYIGKKRGKHQGAWGESRERVLARVHGRQQSREDYSRRRDKVSEIFGGEGRPRQRERLFRDPQAPAKLNGQLATLELRKE